MHDRLFCLFERFGAGSTINSEIVSRSTPAIASLLANVCHRQYR